MESQPQNPELRINPVYVHPYHSCAGFQNIVYIFMQPVLTLVMLNILCTTQVLSH